MKARSIKYLTGEGLKNVWVNRLMSIASIGVLVACMVLIGISVLISLNAQRAMEGLEQQNVVMVYFNDRNSVLYGTASTASSNTAATDSSSSEAATGGVDEFGIAYDSYVVHNDDEAKAVCDQIAALENVASVTYVTSEQGLADLKESFLEGQEQYFTFLDDEYGNPLSCGAKVILKDLSRFDETLEAIKQVNGVDTIQSQSDLAEKITNIKEGITVAGFWIISILLIISLVIVSNTIRVTMYNRKLEISIMKAVGATDAFIRLPFVVEGVVLGIISALISEVVVYFCYRVILETLGSVLGATAVVQFSSVALYILGIFAFIGIAAGVIGSVIMISKYLRHEGSEFRAYN